MFISYETYKITFSRASSLLLAD